MTPEQAIDALVARIAANGNLAISFVSDWRLSALVSGKVETLVDYSGNTFDATQSNAAMRETYDAVNGVSFVPANTTHYYWGGTPLLGNADPSVLFVRCKHRNVPSGGSQQVYLVARGATPVFDSLVFRDLGTYANVDVSARRGAVAVATVGKALTLDTTERTWGCGYDGSTTAGDETLNAHYSKIRRSGADENPADFAGVAGAATTNTQAIGVFRVVGPSYYNLFDGWMKKWFIATGTPGGTDIADIEAWMAA